MTVDPKRLHTLLVRSVQDDSHEADNATRLARAMLAKDHEFNVRELLRVLDPHDVDDYAYMEEKVLQANQRSNQNYREKNAIWTELEAYLARSLILKLQKKFKRAKDAGDFG